MADSGIRIKTVPSLCAKLRSCRASPENMRSSPPVGRSVSPHLGDSSGMQSPSISGGRSRAALAVTSHRSRPDHPLTARNRCNALHPRRLRQAVAWPRSSKKIPLQRSLCAGNSFEMACVTASTSWRSRSQGAWPTSHSLDYASQFSSMGASGTVVRSMPLGRSRTRNFGDRRSRRTGSGMRIPIQGCMNWDGRYCDSGNMSHQLQLQLQSH